MPKGREHKPGRAVKSSRDGVETAVTKAAPAPTGPGGTPCIETDPAALRHASMCRLVASGFDRVERAIGGLVWPEPSLETVAAYALVAAAFTVTPSARASQIARTAWDLADAWYEERVRHHARLADEAKKREVGR